MIKINYIYTDEDKKKINKILEDIISYFKEKSSIMKDRENVVFDYVKLPDGITQEILVDNEGFSFTKLDPEILGNLYTRISYDDIETHKIFERNYDFTMSFIEEWSKIKEKFDEAMSKYIDIQDTINNFELY